MKRVYILCLAVLSGCSNDYAASRASDKKDDLQALQGVFEKELCARAGCPTTKQLEWLNSPLAKSPSTEKLAAAFTLANGQQVYYDPKFCGREKCFFKRMPAHWGKGIGIAELEHIKTKVEEVKCSAEGLGSQLQPVYLGAIKEVLAKRHRERSEAIATFWRLSAENGQVITAERAQQIIEAVDSLESI